MKSIILPKNLLIAILTLSFISASNAQEIPHRHTNVILMIGDGMGVTQVYAGLTMNHGSLNLEQFKSIGFSKTQSASDYITDSGAGGTAISIGQKTFNGAIGVDSDSVPQKTILEYAEENGMATGLVVTSSITDATPAAFISHQTSRYNLDNIALDFLKTDIEVFIGGGRMNFTGRKDSINLLDSLRQRGYQVMFSMDSIRNVKTGKLAGLTADAHNPTFNAGRGDMLPVATEVAINILKNNENGFFVMIEGSHIDKQAHVKNTSDVANEMIDFDNTIGKVLEFARKDGNTLVVVTADHETGGMNLTDGDFNTGSVTAEFNSTGNHTGVMVPVFAFGPGAEKFQGIQENSDLFYKLMSVLDISPE